VSLDLAALVWKETRPFMLDGAIKMAVGNYLGENDVDDFEDEEEDELLNQYNDDGEFNYDEY
jgi:hypothetical protein